MANRNRKSTSSTRLLRSSRIPSKEVKKSPIRERRPSSSTRFDTINHVPVHLNGKKRCKLCIKAYSRVKCEKCNVALCLNKSNNCFKKFHATNKNWNEEETRDPDFQLKLDIKQELVDNLQIASSMVVENSLDGAAIEQSVTSQPCSSLDAEPSVTRSSTPEPRFLRLSPSGWLLAASRNTKSPAMGPSTLQSSSVQTSPPQLSAILSSVAGPAVTRSSFTECSITAPPATEPSTTQPSITQPSITKPSITQPSITKPFITHLSFTKPCITQPSFTNPSITQLSFTNPSITQPPVTESSITQQSVTEPSIAQPSVSKPSITQPSTQSSVQPPTTQCATIRVAFSQPTKSQWLGSFPQHSTLPLIHSLLPILHAPPPCNKQSPGCNNQSTGCNIQSPGCNNQPSSCNNQPSSFNTQPSSCNNQPSSFNTQPSSCNNQPSGYGTVPPVRSSKIWAPTSHPPHTSSHVRASTVWPTVGRPPVLETAPNNVLDNSYMSNYRVDSATSRIMPQRHPASGEGEMPISFNGSHCCQRLSTIGCSRFDFLGKNWAEKMKTLQRNQRIYAEKLINDVLYEAEVNHLDQGCRIVGADNPRPVQ